MDNLQKVKLKRKRIERNRRSFILFLILCIGIGFALYSTTLLMRGKTYVRGHSMNIHLENPQFTEGSVLPRYSEINSGGLGYDANFDLRRPGDFAEFTVDIVNDGDIDVLVQTVSYFDEAGQEPDSKFFNYSITYLDGNEMQKGQYLYAQQKKVVKFSITYKKDIDISDLEEFGEYKHVALRFYVRYRQTPNKRPDSNFISLVSGDAEEDADIDFSEVSSSTNGRGLYLLTKTESTERYRYPIYYYRGAVDNNNAKFAGLCWKIVRTTNMGGVKLLYNGEPDGNGDCSNTTGSSTQLATTTAFNTNANSPAYNGYMYGTVYGVTSGEINNSHLYGASYRYFKGNYKLVDTQDEADENHHYTCLNDTGVCSSLAYIYHLNGTTAYYITLTNGESLNDAFSNMKTSTTDSAIKTVVDTWFHDTLIPYFTNESKDYEDYLEDSPWNNDRNPISDEEVVGNIKESGWNPNGGDLDNHFYYSSYGRVLDATPKLTLTKREDAFALNVSDTEIGSLDYPVGLLDADEVVLAGGQLSSVASQNTDFYLNTNTPWWTMTPSKFDLNGSNVLAVTSNTGIDSNVVSTVNGVRPAIVLKNGTKIASGGDGTAESPYEFVLE